MTEKPVVAIFDLDYTLTKRGTWGRFVWRSVQNKPHLWLPLLFSTLSFQIQYKFGKIPRGAVKKTMMRWSLMRLPRERLEQMAEAFARETVKTGLRPGGIAALEYHRDKGHQILIASAAVDLVVAPICKYLNIHDFVATEMAWDESGALKENFASPNCYGEAKRDRTLSFLKQSKKETSTLYFYTDSKADLPLLKVVDCPIVVDPSPKFKEIAEACNMRVQNWMASKEGFEAV
ncbi:HAD superfamily hydrolase (TIGR01490 family) [Litorimonas taeanensis]|uniref:HAD superfamily hydrolase (TIGR01490 family) n=1 Tax=Litorimonas taeanensis TaxID=568099 RepID=A0A420WKQ2_9PROT|nr:HAD-IB family hydrolase [Litorimonas taeanensis]RKQ71549.1 HAD superfamily hydrolase (TIGR01490 family) [Litorimonas taeanensis]